MASPDTHTENPSSVDTNSTRRPLLKVAIGVAALIAVVLLGRLAGGYVQPFAQWVDGLGFWGPLVFVLAYAAAVVAFVPASLLTLGAGAIFGVVWGVIYVFVAATIGAGLSFLVARYVARAAVEKRLATNEKIIAVDRAVAAEGRKIVFLLRLVPIIPFNALNYGLGLTRVSFADYLVGSIGMIPATLMYVYSGKVAGDVAELASGASVAQGAGYYAFLGLGLAATIAVTIVITRIARRALVDVTGE
ncbi:MAG: TVP38/TMEM64 family protein [Myxococcota bacterium]